jgi:putative transcriptional regulator
MRIVKEYGDMSKVGKQLLAAAREARAFARGEAVEGFRVHVPDQIDVKAVRNKLGVSQTEFATFFGVDVASVRNWEQGRRRPEGPARVLLKVIEHRPEAVREALAA